MIKYCLFFIILNIFSIINIYAQGYKNPVISGFYPDPSVCRVENDYYLVTSTFCYFPGVPIFHSKDLINWKQIGNCLTRKSQVNLYGSNPSTGIYAPTIRYNDGTFYMITTNVSHGGNFFVKTTDPTSDWSEPIFVNQRGIDPSLFFENGKCYLTTADDAIFLSEIDITTGKILSDIKCIWRGTGGRRPEAPHIYKKDDWYYLVIAEGGTEYGHKVTIARSKAIEGPYESNPSNPILTHIDRITQESPIQGTGHADFVQAHDGSWWTVFLAFRPQFGNHHILGRETFLSPIRWDKNAWPVINGNGTVDINMVCNTLPVFLENENLSRSHLRKDEINPDWLFLRNPIMENYFFNNGLLRIKPTDIKLDNKYLSPTFIGKRLTHTDFYVTSQVKCFHFKDNDKAGLTLYMNNESHYDIYIKKTDKQYVLELRCHLGLISYIVKEINIPTKSVYLKILGDGDKFVFEYSLDGIAFLSIAGLDKKYLSTETAGGFTGIIVAMFAESEIYNEKAIVDFSSFSYVGK